MISTIKHPSSESVHWLAGRFEKLVREYPGASVDMTNPCIRIHKGRPVPECSPACHTGWYVVVRHAELARQRGKGCVSKATAGVLYGFDDGARIMARDLGFECAGELLRWALENPGIWGNKNGTYMFTSSAAFGVTDEGSITQLPLSMIASHWRQVALRLQSLEKAGLIKASRMAVRKHVAELSRSLEGENCAVGAAA